MNMEDHAVIALRDGMKKMMDEFHKQIGDPNLKLTIDVKVVTICYPLIIEEGMLLVAEKPQPWKAHLKAKQNFNEEPSVGLISYTTQGEQDV